MNLINAIQSGRRFRRPGLSYYISVHNNRLHTEANGVYHITVYDLVADDWTLEEKSIKLTQSEFDSVLASLGVEIDLGVRLIDALFGDKS